MKLAAVMYSPLFVYAVIGVALLGYGAAGSLRAAHVHSTARATDRTPAALGRWLTAFAAVTLPTFLVVDAVRLPAHVLFGSLRGLPVLLGVYALLTLPFLCLGLGISSVFAAFDRDVNRLYFADLVGAGTGSALAIATLPWLGGPALLAGAGGAGALGALLALGAAGRRRGLALGVCLANVGLLAVFLVLHPLDVHVASDKHGPLLGRAAKPGGLAVEMSRWSRLGRVDVTEPFATLPPQFGGDVSPVFGDVRVEQRMLTLDGAAPAFLYRVAGSPADLPFLAGTSQSPAYRLRPDPRVLVIGVGGGTDVLIALALGATQVTAVEINPVAVAAARDVYGAYVGHVLSDPRVEVVVAEGRNFAARSRAQYDIVQLSGVDTGAALGAYGLGTMPESYVYTREAMGDFLARLAPDGVLSVTRDVRFGWALRLVALARAALTAAGLDPGSRIAVLEGKGYGWATVLVKREAFAPAEVAALRDFAARYEFPLAYDPLAPGVGRYAATALEGTLAEGEFDLRPATDDWPFFFLNFRWKHALPALLRQASPLTNPLAFLIVNLLGLAAAAAALIGWPLLARREAWRTDRGTVALAGYFALIGAAFMLVEVALMQRFTLFLGNPVLAVATVLGALLVSSGGGSYVARRAHGRDVVALAIAWIVVALLCLASPLLPHLLRALLAAPIGLRLGVTIAIVMLTGVPMGIPFPAGLARAAERAAPFVPWGWGINGMVSVTSSLASYLVGMVAGYTAMFYAGAALYLGALVLSRRW